MRRAITTAMAFAAFFGLPAPTVAQNPYSCPVTNPKEPLEDGQLYYTSVGTANWTKVSTNDFHLLPRGSYSFAYVIRDALGQRDGVLVIKSGRYQDATRPSGDGKNVLMIRTESRFTKTRRCRTPSPFDRNGESVSASSYDGYHDFGYQRSESDMEKIKRFHVEYENANRQCVATDDSTSDKTSSGFWRSNRSQFSFDDYRVDNGLGWQLADAGRSAFVRTYAADEKWFDRQVEIRRYETGGPQPVCVTFNISVSGPNHFLSVNDLERWEHGIRGAEARWNHRN
jgi:hypothetical protein